MQWYGGIGAVVWRIDAGVWGLVQWYGGIGAVVWRD